MSYNAKKVIEMLSDTKQEFIDGSGKHLMIGGNH